MSYEVKTEAFEGPLDLLLHLINRLEIDIYDIKMAEITTQYMEHIHAMRVLELNEASEYLVMAATLLSIKSKMLLPIHQDDDMEDDFDINLDDPRDELVLKLIEYKKYKEAASNLQELEETRNLFYTRPPADLSGYQSNQQLALFELDVNVYDMLGAFQKMLRRKQLNAPLHTKVSKQEISIRESMTNVITTLKKHNGRLSFYELFPTRDKNTIVTTFLALLELMKRQAVLVEQKSNFEDLFVQLGKEIEIYEEIKE
ncbi:MULTISPECIES: segregation/condensation protein A [unclassified Psychrobacillus]|uniref:segregation/condensation protein A n=1 Tax=unclassified Psychrobacillus TaxID=2636677 RepID=UPI00146C82DE|nr:segregation/condensation protein A [Psychrobacillus sp. BL-248-WT-3]NME07607.1 segregation/condensation protein A [Psychrobacillus sp. BL-248-WT-3]